MSEQKGPADFNIILRFPTQEAADEAATGLYELAQAAATMTGAVVVRGEVIFVKDETIADVPSESAAPVEKDVFSPDVQQRLDTPIEEALRDPEARAQRVNHLADLAERLKGRGLYTAREVLCVGKWGLTYTEDITLPFPFNEKRTDLVRRRLVAAIPEVKLLGRVTPQRAATFCRGLNEVPVFAVCRVGSNLVGSRFGISPVRMSIQEALEQGGQAFVTLGIAPEEIDEWMELTQQYAEQFAAAKASQDRSSQEGI